MFSQNLLKWYKTNARDLPWRKTKDPYKIWISEIMLQQTTVATVIPYYERWTKMWPTVEAVSQASTEEILKQWQGLGYYSRAKNIHRAAQIVCQEFKGKLPDEPQALRKLPGFGPYTVGAVLSIAFDKRHPIIDANVRRVVMRYLAIKGLADPSQDETILKFLETVMPQKEMSFFNQALMELGALVCRNKEPLCILCPIKNNCAAYLKGIQEIIPTPKKKVLKEIHAVIALIKKDGAYFIQKRPAKGLLADLWEFPGGKVEANESLSDALKREIKEELNVQVTKAAHWLDLQHFYTEFRVKLHVFNCELKVWPKIDDTHCWVKIKDFDRYAMPSGSAKIVDHIKRLAVTKSDVKERQLSLANV